MNVKLFSPLLIITMAAASCAFAQKDYALSAKGDTLKGELKINSFDNLDRLQVNAGGKKSSFTALQIKSFVKEGITYQSVKYDNSIRFMRVIKSGYLSLLAFNQTNQGSWDGRYLTKKDGSSMEVPNLAFKKLLSKYLGDCQEVHDRIENGELPKRDLEKIVDLYNVCLQVKTETQTTAKPSSAPSFDSEKMLAIKKLSEKVEAENFLTKKDVLDLLKDIQGKVSKNEAVPNYLAEGLKSYLADTPSLLKEANELVALLKK
ncbi:MAG: hypothetical protein HYR67_18755 [Bacteroidetes bacterium]|nr:hypothetical protein [Bacteroidota bacterium]